MNAARAAALLVAAAVVAGAPAAHANGAFPASGQILVDPGDPARIGVRTTYGLVSTEDGGAHWRWTCEAALGIADDEHPQLAIGPDGVVFGGVADGLVRGALGACAWEHPSSLAGRRVVDVSQDASGRAIAAVEAEEAGGRAEVWSSLDGAQTWARLGAVLPVKLRPLTLDTAPGGRIYVSGLLDVIPVRGAIAWSDDEGATWGLHEVLDADGSKAPFIGAVDPVDPDVVWVRLGAAPGQLVVTRDGGASWETALVLDGFLRAFALSPDGTEILAGGEVDGLLRASTDTLDFVPFAPIAARCARWREDAIDVCGTESLDGFTAARSTDDGASFVPLYVQACLEGPLPCGDDTPVGACAAAWPALRDQLGGGCGEGGAGGGGGPGGADAATTTTAATGPATTTAATTTGPGGGAGGGDDPGPADGGGCGCRSTRGEPGGSMAALAAAALTWAAGRRRSITEGGRR